MMIKKLIAAAITAGAIVSLPASAGVLGMADLAITALGILNSNGAPVTSGITVVSDSRTGTAASNYNGVVGTGIGAGSIASFTPGDTVDVQYRCSGPSCGTVNAIYGGSAENNTLTHLKTAAGNFSLGDMYIDGDALGVTGANGLTRADSSTIGATNKGGANSTILNSVTAETLFTVSDTMSARFVLGYNAFVKAFVDAANPSNEKGIGSGAISWSLSLTSVDDASFVALNWSPSEINKGFTSTKASNNQEYESAGTVFSDLRTLTSGKTYSLTINQASNSLASQIPEPASIMLLGMGLFAIGAASRRRRNK